MELETVTYQQFRNIEKIKYSEEVYFSYECYQKLVELIHESKRTNIEYGCFFIGELIETAGKSSVIIDAYTSQFVNTSTSVEVTDDILNQAFYETNKKFNSYSGCKVAMIHFHTHPRNESYKYENFSDQDLHVYAKSQEDNNLGGRVAQFGLLGFPVPGQDYYGLSLVRPINPEKRIDGIFSAEFYRYNKFSYLDINDRICNFDMRSKMHVERTYGAKTGIIKNPLFDSGINSFPVVL